MKKRINLFILLLGMLIMLTSCSKIASVLYEKYYDTTLRAITEGVFPRKIPENASNIKFNFENKRTSDHAEHQVWLEYTLCEEDYINQVNQISKIKGVGTESDIRYNKNDYNYEAYVAVDCRQNKNETFYIDNEYILLDKENFRIIHIFLDDIENRNVKFPKEYLPKKIDEEQERFSINMEKGDS